MAGSRATPETGACESRQRRVHRGLRFTHKTMLIELGVPEILQDEGLGHHPPGTRGVYAHTTVRMRAAMTDGLQALCSPDSLVEITSLLRQPQ